MRSLVFFVIIGLFLSCSVVKPATGSVDAPEVNSMYKIKKIKNKKSFYIIYALRNDSTFKIISDIDSTNTSGCEDIKIGKSYILDLKVVFPLDSLFGKPVAPNLGIKGIIINNEKVVKAEEKSHNKIYTALNLHGLCIKQ